MWRKNLFIPPKLWTAEAPRERHATWLELFYDLVFVAVISQLASNLNRSYTSIGLLRFVLLFVPVWWAWIGQTFYLTRFDSNDVGHRLFAMAQIITVAFMAVNIPEALGATSIGFALSYAAGRFVLIGEYMRAALAIPVARPLIIRYMIGFGLAATLWVASTFIPIPYRFYIWAVALFVDFFEPLAAIPYQLQFPPHMTHAPERFGLFTIIVLGEAIFSVITGLQATMLTFASGVAGLMGLIIAFTFWWAYFESVRATDVRILGPREQVGKYTVWMYGHLPLLIGIASAAIGINHVILSRFRELLPSPEAWILSISLSICVFSLIAIFLSSFTVPLTPAMRLYMVPHFTLGILVVMTGALGGFLPGLAILGILTLLRIVHIIYTLIQPPMLPPG